MKRYWTAMGIVLLALVSACGDDTKEAGEQVGTKLDAKLVQFYPGTHISKRKAAILTHPAQWNGFSSWYAVSSAGVSIDEIKGPTNFNKKYVATAVNSGCRVATSASLSRDGDQLVTHLRGGQDHEECVAAYTAIAVFEVDADEVETIKKVDGMELSDPQGPAGKPLDFVKLGTTPVEDAALSVELGTDAAGVLLQQLEATQPQNLDEARSALEYRAAEDEKAYAFILGGCGETNAVLSLTQEDISSKAFSREALNCDAQMYYLATFHVAKDLVPQSATPS